MDETPRLSRIVISTALGPAGAGIFPYTWWPAYRRLLWAVKETGATVFTKSATRHRRRGNFIAANPLTWKYIRRLPHMGMLNAYGLTNDGAAAVAPEIKRALGEGFFVIPNLYPEFAKGTEIAIQETLEALDIYRENLGPQFTAVELNFSCPNSTEAIAANVEQSLACTRQVREHAPGLAIIAKISICHPYEFSQELENLGIWAIHGINTIPYDILYPPALFPPSPLQPAGGGGVSGGPAWEASFAYNAELRRKVRGRLIMGCGVISSQAVERCLDAGAEAVSLCTLALRDPAAAARLLFAYNDTRPGF